MPLSDSPVSFRKSRFISRSLLVSRSMLLQYARSRPFGGLMLSASRLVAGRRSPVANCQLPIAEGAEGTRLLKKISASQQRGRTEHREHRDHQCLGDGTTRTGSHGPEHLVEFAE